MHLEGDKTCIRTIIKQDLPLLVKWKNDPVIAEFVSGNPILTTLEIEERRFERCLEDYDTIRLIVENKQGNPIGFISISEIDKFNKKVELGILIGEKAEWSKGYGTDALDTILDYLLNKLGFNRVSVEVFRFNHRAKGLYERLGFEVEGVQRQGLCKSGHYEDILLMGLLKKDYLRKKTEATERKT